MKILKEIRSILGASTPFKVDIFETSIGFSLYEVESYICLNNKGEVYFDLDVTDGKLYSVEVEEIYKVMKIIETHKMELLAILE